MGSQTTLRGPDHKKENTMAADAMKDTNREKALTAALSQIERQFGKGSMMRLGDKGKEAIPSMSDHVEATGPDASMIALRRFGPFIDPSSFRIWMRVSAQR